MTNKTQKREIVIRELEDGSFEADVPTCSIGLKEKEVIKFFRHWKNKELNVEDPLGLGTPKIIKESKEI